MTLGYNVFYLSLIVLVPIPTLFLRSATMGGEAFWQTVSDPRVVASYRLTFGAALVDLPFALPTAVSGLALTALYAPNDWIGR